MSGGATDTLSDLMSGLLERLNNPLIFSFCVSFILVHFDAFLYLLLSEAPSSERMETYFAMMGIENGGGWFANTYETSSLPLLLAVLYTFIWPYINGFIKASRAIADSAVNWVMSKISKALVYNQDDQNKLHNNNMRLLQQLEDQRKFSAEIYSQKTSLEQEVKDQAGDVVKLNSQLVEAMEQLSNTESENKKALSEIHGLNDNIDEAEGELRKVLKKYKAETNSSDRLLKLIDMLPQLLKEIEEKSMSSISSSVPLLELFKRHEGLENFLTSHDIPPPGMLETILELDNTEEFYTEKLGDLTSGNKVINRMVFPKGIYEDDFENYCEYLLFIDKKAERYVVEEISGKNRRAVVLTHVGEKI